MSAAPEERFEVGDLDPAGVLALASETEREVRRLEALKLELAAHWADLHPATADTGVETPGGPALDVLDADESLGGRAPPRWRRSPRRQSRSPSSYRRRPGPG